MRDRSRCVSKPIPTVCMPVIYACVLALAAIMIMACSPAPVRQTTAVSPASAPADRAPTLEQCKRRITSSATQIDSACLRRVYNLPITQWPRPWVDSAARWSELAPLAKTPPEPNDNRSTPAKIALGKRLFEDPKLSSSGQIACATCHDRQLGWSDGRSVPFGQDRTPGRRNALSVAMAAYSQPLFWDGRAATLEAQAVHPILDRAEMGFSLPELERRLNRDRSYRQTFLEVFASDRITVRDISRALASYQRTLTPRFNRFDRFLQGRRDLFDDQQLRGLHVFRTRARCMNCHSGPTLSNNGFHNLGLHFYGRAKQDLGRYEVTGDPADVGKFRTPSLRNVRKTAPYMHTGSFFDLRAMLNLYNVGMPRPVPKPGSEYDPPFPAPDPLLHPLDLHKSELDALAEFLRTL